MLIFLLKIFIGCFCVYALFAYWNWNYWNGGEKNKKNFGKIHFFLNRGIFIFEYLLNPYYLPIAMGGWWEEQRPYGRWTGGVITNILNFYYYGYFKWNNQKNGRKYRWYDLQISERTNYCKSEDYEHCKSSLRVTDEDPH